MKQLSYTFLLALLVVLPYSLHAQFNDGVIITGYTDPGGDIRTSFGTALVITEQPQNYSVPLGANPVNFSITLNNAQSVQYQWRFNGTNIPGGTQSSLTVDPNTVAVAGAYSVFVSNATSSVLSSEGILNVYTNRTSIQSAQLSLEHLRNQMDLYHSRVAVYEDIGSGGNHFFAQGQISNGASVFMDASCTDQPHSGATAIKCTFEPSSPTNWGGFYFLNGLLVSNIAVPYFGEALIPGTSTPVTNWSGLDLSGAATLTFWIRGENGNESIELFMGGVGRDPVTHQPSEPYWDSTSRYPASGSNFIASKEWKQYTINLTKLNLTNIMGGFGWVADARHNPTGAVFYLDDIQYNLTPSALSRRLNVPHFIKSYVTRPLQPGIAQEDVVKDFDYDIRNAAFTYDNALAILAFLADGSADSLRRAQILGNAFVYATSHDRTYTNGQVRSAYSCGDISVPRGWIVHDLLNTVSLPGFYNVASQTFYEVNTADVDTGDNAWTMIALEALYKKTRNHSYLNTSLSIGNFISQTLRANSGTYQGFIGGISNAEQSAIIRPYASTEHNLDIFAAFRQMAMLTGDPSWNEGATHAEALVEQMWDESNGCYLAGTTSSEARNQNPTQLPVDVQSWNILSRTNILSLHPQLLANAQSLFGTNLDGFDGVDFNSDRDGVWFEGIGQLCVARSVAGSGNAKSLADTLADAQQLSNPVGNSLGLVAASHDAVTTGFTTEFGTNYYHRRLHIGATCWNVFAQLGFNPYYQTSAARPGVYNGLFFDPESIAKERAGMLYRLTITSQRACTGTLYIDGGGYTFSGHFDNFGTCTVNIHRAARAGGALKLQIINNTENAPMLTGTISGTNGGAWTAMLTAYMAINTPSGQFTMLLQPTGKQNGICPPGSGYVLAANHSGTVILSGYLADGTPFTAVTSADSHGNVPLFANLNGNRGILIGWINLNSSRNFGDIVWIQKTASFGSYRSGFTNQMTMLGSAWTSPPLRTAAINIPSGQLQISGGNLVSPLTFNVSVTVNNTLLKLPRSPTNSLVGYVNPRLGLLTILFGNGIGRTTIFARGTVLQNANIGAGFFLGKTNAGSFSLYSQ